MKQAVLTLLFFALIPLVAHSHFYQGKLFANGDNQVCVIIDQADTGHPKYPNIATLVDDFTQSFNLYDQKEACFDLDKLYYFQYFLWESRNAIVYGTKCRYDPKREDAGKTVRFEGLHGETLCPVLGNP